MNGNQFIEPLRGMTLSMNTGLEYPLSLMPVLLGRLSECSVQLESLKVSRHHALISRFGTHFIIQDLGSTNGLEVNGRSVLVSPLFPNSKFTIGDFAFTLKANDIPLTPCLTAGAVLVLTIADFDLAEKHPPGFGEYLNTVLKKLEEHLLTLKGCLVKRMENGLVCVFGQWPPLGEKNLRDQLKNAMAFIRYSVRYIKRLPRSSEMEARVGLAWGDVLLRPNGETGLDPESETVQQALLLNLLNRTYGTTILINEAMVHFFDPDDEDVLEVDNVQLDRTTPILNLYTIPEIPAYEPPRASGSYKSDPQFQAYRQGFSLYRQQKFKPALAQFQKAASLGPATTLQNRVALLMEQPDATWLRNWKGVWVLAPEKERQAEKA